MAKKKAAAEAAPATEKKVRAPREKKDSYQKNNYVLINDYDGVKTEAMYMRGVGTLVRETTESGQVASTFIPGVKVKTKKDWKYLIIDKGPKSKKGSTNEDEDDESEDESED